MKASIRWIPIAVALMGILAFALLDIREPSPGPLIPSHHGVAELQGRNGCVQCHGNQPSDLGPSCLACHESIESDILAGQGLHGSLGMIQQAQCGSCHPEHLTSPSHELLNFSFRQASLGKVEDFAHETLDFHLQGAHDSLECKECHQQALVNLLPKETPRFLGLSQDCTTCHEDPHKGQMQRSCQSCHGQEHDFADLSRFPHLKEIPLHGSHSGLDCAECHQSETSYSVEALSPLDLEITWRNCASCHESPHTNSFLKNTHYPEEWKSVGRDECALCHSEQDETFLQTESRWKDPWHKASGFALEEPHANLDCKECHGTRESKEDFSLRYPKRNANDCASCHQDPHAGQFDIAKYQEKDCLSCHKPSAFLPHDFSLVRHNEESYELRGAHATVKCEDCHKPDVHLENQPVRFLGTLTKCVDCHTDPHDNAFQPYSEKLDPVPEGDCARCHQPTDFQDLTREFDHGQWTPFPLTKGHDQLDCQACHQRNSLPDEHGRTLGKVSLLYPGDPASCVGCHEDIHLGSFSGNDLPHSIQGKIGCARCHSTESFQEVPASKFDHGTWTSFPLTGAHDQAECASCHGVDQVSQRLGRLQDHYPGDPSKCITCHQDPHAGTFQRPHLELTVNGKTDCARCHTTSSFRKMSPVDFHHEKWTDFPLLGAHLEADCTSCHQPLGKQGPLGRSFGEAIGTSCTDCHSDPHLGQFIQKGVNDCLKCHDSGIKTFEIPNFAHNRLSTFALDQNHAQLDCSACHVERLTAQGQRLIQYKPLGNQCIDCHSAGRTESGR